MPISQDTIDSHLPGAILMNNPDGGSGDDYTEYCQVVHDPDDPSKPLLWKPNEDTPDDSELCHHVGIHCPRGYSIAYKVMDMDNFYTPIPLNNCFGRVIGIGFINLRGDNSPWPINVANSSEIPFIFEDDPDVPYDLETPGVSDHVEDVYYTLPGNIKTDALYVRVRAGLAPKMLVYVIFDPNDNILVYRFRNSTEEEFTILSDGVWESITVKTPDGEDQITKLQISGKEVLNMSTSTTKGDQLAYINYITDDYSENERTIDRDSTTSIEATDSDVTKEVYMQMRARTDI